MKHQTLFSSKGKRKKIKMSSAAILLGSLRVNLIFIPRHMLVTEYYVFMSAVRVSVRQSVRPSVRSTYVRPHFVFVRKLKYLLWDFIQILHMHSYQEGLAWDF